jgi:hypothetical protein
MATLYDYCVNYIPMKTKPNKKRCRYNNTIHLHFCKQYDPKPHTRPSNS